jgi:hypothetical protein
MQPKAIQVKSSQAARMITTAIKARLVPFLKGSPGCGKSQIIHQIAKDHNLEVIDLRLSQCDPTDLAGFPTIIDGKADYMPMKHFPIEGDSLPKGKAGWLLFLDEATSAPSAIQAAAYKLVLDRMVGSHHLHKNVAIALAGNLESDGAIVHEMSTALESRLVHMELVVDATEWNNWAIIKGLDSRITSYINYKPGSLYTFSADHTDCTYACPRTWEFADRLLKEDDDNSVDALPLLSGTLSEGVAREFLAFCKIYRDLITVEEICKDPVNCKVPSEPSKLFALCGSIAEKMTDGNVAGLIQFVFRMPAEFQVICLREAVRRNKAILKNEALHTWITKSGKEFF